MQFEFTRINNYLNSFTQIGFKVYRVDSTTEELNAPYFSYKRNDGGHKCLAKTPTWQGTLMTSF